MTIVEWLTANPWAVVALAVVMRAGLAWQRSLSWPEYRLLHGVKRRLFPILQRRAPLGFDSFVNAKGGREDAEFLRTVPASVPDVVGWLSRGDGSLHLLNSVKRRPDTHGDPLSAAHVVWVHPDGTQTEAYLFANADGTTDVYAHTEPSPSRPLAHLGGEAQSDGDVRGIVTEALDRNP
jgi:hypothetical protein